MRFKLQHSRGPVEKLSQTSWEGRDEALREFFESEGWLWSRLPQGMLDEKRLLEFLKTPVPKRVARLYRMWGVNDIFRRITRAEHTRTRFLWRLKELVEKRNNIAHGDFTIETTRGDVDEYLDVVVEFCRRADGVLAKVLRRWGCAVRLVMTGCTGGQWTRNTRCAVTACRFPSAQSDRIAWRAKADAYRPGLARSAILALGRDLTARCHHSWTTGIDWRESAGTSDPAEGNLTASEQRGRWRASRARPYDGSAERRLR